MRKFTNRKAQEIFNQSVCIENEANNRMKIGEILPYTYAEMMTEAAGLRALADDVEDELISEDELEGA